MKGPDDEANEVHGRADRGPAGAGGGGGVPAPRHQLGDVLRLQGEVWRAERVEARRLKMVEDENAKLKRLLVDAMLDNVALKELVSKKF